MKYYTKNQSIEAMQVERDNLNDVLEWCHACEPIYEFVESSYLDFSYKQYLRSFGGFMVHNAKGSTCANISDYIVKLENDYIVFDELKFRALFCEEKGIGSHIRIEIDGEKMAETIKKCGQIQITKCNWNVEEGDISDEIQKETSGS